jgi:hypothetical protein
VCHSQRPDEGRANYSVYRWEVYRDGVEATGERSRLIDSSDRMLLPIVDDWLKQTDTGDRAELRDLPEGHGVLGSDLGRGRYVSRRQCHSNTATVS